MEQINAVGRRKAAIARVYVNEGTGEITVNKRPLADYFPNPILQYIVKQPLSTLDAAEKYDIKVNLVGGGYKGQAEALRLAIARALVKINPEDKSALRKEGFMTRDPRAVERDQPRGQERTAQGGFHDPRPACCRAQETRSAQGPQEIPVQQALIAA